MKNKFLKNYSFSLLLIAAIMVGAGLGVLLKGNAAALKPFGDIFLNLLFTAVVPLVFFSIASAIAEMSDLRRLGKIMGWMILIFVGTGIISSFLMILGVKFFPPSVSGHPLMELPKDFQRGGAAAQIVRAFTVPDFAHLLSRQNMLALIVFAMLVGLAASLAREDGKPFVGFLVSANKVMMKVIHLIMFYAPVGLGAYFAYLVGTLGPELLGSYLRVVALYYPLAILYFFAGSSVYTWIAGGRKGFTDFWGNILTPALTAWGTGSSLAAVPANFEAADRIGVPKDVSRIVIPIGATIHMDGTCMSAIVKISLLFTFFGLPFGGVGTYVTAVGVAILSGMVMSGIPGGGFLGELLIVTLYGFPAEALPLISMVGTLVDPPATMVNSTGDTVASMLVSRILNGHRRQASLESSACLRD
ncbi:MAG TPA: dicarboxylate/amino acid:cation symporter [Candidatus Omnitrophota bacterium]|nr:dicarboxylate/amino acid:cation symporter [Candidatus Omnitrophota bacterium]HPS36304.1 dicarboxylate/amino acid:cation symporter [Candidatus Omnitrophota bacterium]